MSTKADAGIAKLIGPGLIVRDARVGRFVRKDLAIAYGFTAIFGISIMTMSSRAFHEEGIAITDSRAVTRLAEMLGGLLGPVGFYVYSLGFWAAVFAALLGVWQSVPYLHPDFYAVWKKASAEERSALTEVGSTPDRIALAYVSLAPIPFAFLGRPLFIIVVYTIVGSCSVRPWRRRCSGFTGGRGGTSACPGTAGSRRLSWFSCSFSSSRSA